MHIVVITGSPHKQGTSFLLAQKFIRGATEAGHSVFRFDAAFEKVHPCIGCDACACGSHPCVFPDAMAGLYPELQKADLVAFVTPLYYHAMSAQLAAVIDRFHGIDNLLRGTGKGAVLLVTAADPEQRVMNGVVGSYLETLHYLQWQDRGKVLATGCGQREDIEKTDYPAQAYALGAGL